MHIEDTPDGFDIRHQGALFRVLNRRRPIAAYVYVPLSLRGQGLATALYREARAEAERRGTTLRPGITTNPAVLRIREKIFQKPQSPEVN